MKNLKLILSICLLAVTTTASAQFANGSKKSSSSPTASTESYSRLYMSYNPQTVKFDYKGAEDRTLHGITLGYTRGFSLTQKLPLFLELGARFNYGFKKEFPSDFGYDKEIDDYADVKHTNMNIAVPINLAYKFQIPNSEVSIAPFVGITLKYNIVAKTKIDITNDELKEYLEEEGYDDEDFEMDYFDKKDVEDTWKRFQCGWQIGAGMNYKALYLGLHYGSDFGEIAKKTKTSNWGISLGYNF